MLMKLIVLVGIILLQVYLSKKENFWYGLIIPILMFLSSVLFILQIVATDENILILISRSMIFANIPTILLLLIYFTCRNKLKKHKDIDKMNIKDL